MATLNSLKLNLQQEATGIASSTTRSLSDIEYSAGFDVLVRGGECTTYQDFIIPQLSLLLSPLTSSVSVLEVGPGPKSVLGDLPVCLKQNITRYVAYEPNVLFATRLEEWLHSKSKGESPLPCLNSPPDLHRTPFVIDKNATNGQSAGAEKFNVVLFCHSMYGIKPKRALIERALEMLLEGGIAVVFHRDGNLNLDGLVCQQTASFPSGVTRVEDENETLDCFASFIAGFAIKDSNTIKSIRVEWRKVCRTLGRREEGHPKHLLFSSPNSMAVFTQHATSLPELTAQVPLLKGIKTVKNREARLRHPASIMAPKEIKQVQQCVEWALKHGFGLTVFAGGHSGHCLLSNVVSVDMGAFDRVHILTSGEMEEFGSGSGPLIVAGTGCKTGDIISTAMEAGLTVPLGSRPSVGAGLYLQGGIGHLTRLHGLACDAIVGAVMVSVDSGEVLCVGLVPKQHQPANAVRPANDIDLLWAIKGTGTNFGIVVSVTFKAFPAPSYSIRNWVVPFSDNIKAQATLGEIDELVASELPRNCSVDMYLYWDAGYLHLGLTMLESSTTDLASGTLSTTTPSPSTILGPENGFKMVDGVELFDTEMYMSEIHGGHAGSKTSAFKRCLFLKQIGSTAISGMLVKAIETRPSPFCYLHLLHGGGAVGDVASDATAFGCRDWDFACVVTGVWPRHQDGTQLAQAAIQWVYDVAKDLSSLSTGVYGADLGPDPRDAVLAAKAFGPNRRRLNRLKRSLDPGNVLAYACPLLEPSKIEQKLIILVTGESCAGKDYCADIWVSVFTRNMDKPLKARVASISDATKREYAVSTGADINRLLWDRTYKEQHRSKLTAFFNYQVQQQPQLPEKHFLNVVNAAADVEVLLITGMRDEAPVAAFSYLVPDSRLIEVRVETNREIRQTRGGCPNGDDTSRDRKHLQNHVNGTSNIQAMDYHPCFVFNNDSTGDEAAKRFARNHLFPFFDQGLQRLASMARSVPNFPCQGVDFRHVLDISQQPGGLALCTTLLQTRFTGDWGKVQAVVCCEAAGFIYASALATTVGTRLALIREAGKLPPPTVSVVKYSSHISSLASDHSTKHKIEMSRNLVPKGAPVVVVDDVLATGETLCAVLQLLEEASIKTEDVSVMVVAEFPLHRGRELLRQRGFGKVRIQSLLIYGGA
ncbi:hypothetical protein FZEAL_10054 [Fusarium zealandicum]|uniref:FAD-binding PCMH-type domain-containing protein n=1 Tax=Fusarium zealandicum TaxID=1053134 RepID=A0A8H4U687_9HYPO|nr:hypothetical protein FZEAL_10054 [Fusarium zealandicum]